MSATPVLALSRDPCNTCIGLISGCLQHLYWPCLQHLYWPYLGMPATPVLTLSRDACVLALSRDPCNTCIGLISGCLQHLYWPYLGVPATPVLALSRDPCNTCIGLISGCLQHLYYQKKVYVPLAYRMAGESVSISYQNKVRMYLSKASDTLSTLFVYKPG